MEKVPPSESKGVGKMEAAGGASITWGGLEMDKKSATQGKLKEQAGWTRHTLQ